MNEPWHRVVSCRTMTEALFSEPSEPYPPRYQWTKRIAVTTFILLIFLFAAHRWWEHDASTRLDAVNAAIQSRGEPILPQDFITQPIPDDRNAAEYLNKAAAALNSAADSPSSSNVLYSDYLPMTAEWYDIARKAIEGNAKALALVHQARQFTGIDWKLNFKSPVFSMLLPMLNTQRALANLQADTALYQHLSGDDAAALETLRDLLFEAGAVNRQPILVSHLVSIGICALAAQRLQVIAPGLRIADDPSPATTTQPFTPVQRQAVIDMIELLLARGRNGGMTRGLMGERMMVGDTAPWMTAGSSLLSPIYLLDAARLTEDRTHLVAASTQPTWPLAMAVIKSPLPVHNDSLSYVSLLRQSLGSSLNRAIETDFRGRVECDMTAVILAARLYQIDHHGQWPPDLQSLVPKYLPAVPIDRLAAGNKPLGYIILNNGKRPVVYSVGSDRNDDTQNGATVPATPQVRWDQTTVDQWRDLSRFDPPK